MAGMIATALKGYFNRSTPGYLIFFVTPFCACRCKMCFNMDAVLNAARRKVLQLDEIERIARNFPGLHQLNFSGGEPLSRPDFPEIVALFYEHSGTRFFTIPTSSSHPVPFERALKRIAESCPDAWIRVTQSLDGLGELHDEIRQRKGLFDCVVELNGRLDTLCRAYPNLSVGLTTVYCKFNRGHGFELLDFAYENLKFTDMGALFVRGSTPESNAKDVEAEGYVEYQRECIRRRRKRTGKTSLATRAFTATNQVVSELVTDSVLHDRYVMPCQAGRRMVVLDDEGNVEPCEMLGFMIQEGTARIQDSHLGNIRDFDYDIRQVMATDKAKELARQIVKTKCHCSFECALAVSTIYNVRTWPRIAKNFVFLKGE